MKCTLEEQGTQSNSEKSPEYIPVEGVRNQNVFEYNDTLKYLDDTANGIRLVLDTREPDITGREGIVRRSCIGYPVFENYHDREPIGFSFHTVDVYTEEREVPSDDENS